MRSIAQAQRPLSAEELDDYHVNERINDRGVLLDRPLALAAVRYAEAEMVEIQRHCCRSDGRRNNSPSAARR
jgi:hypothetical protein